MIEHLDPNRLSSLVKLFGDLDILPAWPRVAGWMVVDQNHGCRRILDCRSKDLARMNETGIERADGNLMGTDHLVLRV